MFENQLIFISVTDKLSWEYVPTLKINGVVQYVLNPPQSLRTSCVSILTAVQKISPKILPLKLCSCIKMQNLPPHRQTEAAEIIF